MLERGANVQAREVEFKQAEFKRAEFKNEPDLIPLPACLLEGPLHYYLDHRTQKELAKHPQFSRLPAYQDHSRKFKSCVFVSKAAISAETTNVVSSSANVILSSTKLSSPVSAITIMPGEVSFRSEPTCLGYDQVESREPPSVGYRNQYDVTETLKSSGSESQAGVHYSYHEYDINYKENIKHNHVHRDGKCFDIYNVHKHHSGKIIYKIDQSTVTVEDNGNFSDNFNNKSLNKFLLFITPLFLAFGWHQFFESVIRFVKADNKNYLHLFDCVSTFVNALSSTLIFAFSLASITGFIYAAPYVLGGLLLINIIRRCFDIGEYIQLSNQCKNDKDSKYHLKNAVYLMLGILVSVLAFIGSCFAYASFEIKSGTMIGASDLSSIDSAKHATSAMNPAQFGYYVAEYLQGRVNLANVLSSASFSIMIAIFTISLPALISKAFNLNRETSDLIKGHKKLSDTFEGNAFLRMKSIFDLKNQSTSLSIKITRFLLSPAIIPTYGLVGIGHLLFARVLSALVMGLPQLIYIQLKSFFPKKAITAANQNTETILTQLNAERKEIEKRRRDNLFKINKKIERLNQKIPHDNAENCKKHQGQRLLFTGLQKVLMQQIKDEERSLLYDYTREKIQNGSNPESKKMLSSIIDVETIHAHEEKNSLLLYETVEAFEKRIKDGKDMPAEEGSLLASLKSGVRANVSYSNIYQHFFKRVNTTQRLVLEAKEVLKDQYLFNRKLGDI